MSAVIFEFYLQRGGNRRPLCSTSDRAIAAEWANIIDRSLARSDEVMVILVVDGGCILNETPDWRHPDFGRERAKLPLA